MSESIPLQKAVVLCEEYRKLHKVRPFSQCWGCLRFSKGDATKMCFYGPPENRGCAFVNGLFDEEG